jgi:hypothetical protein
MPTEIYKTRKINTIDGQEIEIIPLKIKYLKELMETFTKIQSVRTEAETIEILAECALITMKQYLPNHFKSIEDLEDNFDLASIYDLLNYSAGIDLKKKGEEIVEEAVQEEKEKTTTWESLDLAKLESEVFLLGIWKNFDELETSISIEELMQILSITRELDYEEKKFMAALQGVNLDEQTGKEDEKVRGQKEWEDLKARVASNGMATDSRDILALQGTAARQAGFGIGLGLGYEDLRDPAVLKKP